MNECVVAGEEWRAMTGEGGLYDLGADADVVRRSAARIREIRMRDVELRLVDGRGNPLAGEPVDVEQLGHAFLFGDQLWPLDALYRDGRGAGDRARAWKRRYAEVFNAATSLCYWTERPRNDASKTEDRQGEPRVENFADTIAWTMAEGMTPKGHPLFWSIPKCTPDWVQRYDRATFMKFAEVRVRGLVARHRGKVRVWDAVNEPMWEAAPGNLAARQWPHIEPIPVVVDYIAEVLRWCREEDPDATYLVNDYGMEEEKPRALTGSDGSAVTAASQRRRYAAMLRELRERGSAPDAVGLQAHTGGWLKPAAQWAVYDELGAVGLPLHVTEFWAHLGALGSAASGVPDETLRDLQAEYVANYLTCAFGHPAVEAFFFWGFMGDAVIWRDEFSSHETTALHRRVRDLINTEWHTRARVTTDTAGVARFRGFHGDYTVRVLRGGVPNGRRFTVGAGRGTAEIAVTLCDKEGRRI